MTHVRDHKQNTAPTGGLSLIAHVVVLVLGVITP
jgi:hypothetical protein